MANVASTNTETTPRPFMDRLTHAVIKETSRSLKYYIDVKRRENAFILNPNSTITDSPPLRARLIYGISKDRLSSHSDRDLRTVLPSVQPKPKQFYPSINSPEKQMCREELAFHMRSYNFLSRETSKFTELRLKSSTRSTSTCSTNRDVRPRSSFKLTRHEQDQLINDTADILATIVKSRRTNQETNLLTPQSIPMYISRNINSSPRQLDELSTDLRILSISQQPKREKYPTDDTLSLMQKCKLIQKGFLSEYQIFITTGNCNGASTNASIRMKLYGTNGHTNFQTLSHSKTHHVPFLKDQTDLFTFQTFHVGELIGITIGHDRKDMRASWFLSKISIEDPTRHTIYDIPCNAWLSIRSNDQKTMRDFPVLSKSINLKEHREDNESQSDFSTILTEHTAISNTTNPSESSLKQGKKVRKQQHVSIGPTTISKKPTTATIETHFNPDELPPVPSRRIPSSILSTTSSDTEIEGNITNPTPSTTPTPSPTFNQTRLQSVSEYETLHTKSGSDMFKRHSIDHGRPPGRLEKRYSPLSTSPERTNPTKDENNLLSFFE